MRTVSRRLVLAAPLALAACGGRPGGAVLKVGSQKGGTKALMQASDALRGAPYALQWSDFPAAQPLLEAIGSGAVDVGVAGDAPMLFAYQSGSPIHVIGAQRVEPRPREALAIVVPKASPARTLADLRGKRVATTRGSVGHYLALRALAAAGLPFDAVTFTWLTPGDARAAFDSGSVDAWAIWVPYLTTALADGARVLVDANAFAASYGFDIASEQALRDRRALLVDFERRQATAMAWVARHPDAYAQRFAAETGLPIAIARIVAAKTLRRPVPVDRRVIGDLDTVLATFRKAGETQGTRPIARAFATL